MTSGRPDHRDTAVSDRSGHSSAGQIVPGRCCDVIIDVQDFFLSQAGEGFRCKIIANTGSFARLLAYFRIPIVVTLERPVDQKGSCPQEILKHLGDLSTCAAIRFTSASHAHIRGGQASTGIRFNERLLSDGETVFRHACKLGLGHRQQAQGLDLPLWPIA
jgi:hypothetical protein